MAYPRPFFVFRPQFWLGFGLYAGYPVPYPLALSTPAYVYGYPSGYAEPPAAGTYGGVSFDVTPDDASISVDGTYVGAARDFSPSHQPLTLSTGPHHVELQGPGMEPVAFDVDVVAGQVVPFQGTLQPQLAPQ